MNKHLAATLFLTAVVLTVSYLCGLWLLLKHPSDLNRLGAWWAGGEFLGAEGVVFQQARNDCGPATLAMMLMHFGIPSSVEELRRQANLDAHGTSMLSLIRMAETKGLKAAGWRLTFAELQQAPMPVIAFINHNHFVVVRRIESNGDVLVLDPALGQLRFRRWRFQERWSGETLVFRR